MKKFLNNLKKKFTMERDDDRDTPQDLEEGYVEIAHEDGARPDVKVVVRPFTIEDFSDVKPVLDSLREGYTIALINIKPLKDKDLVELKRAINKLKKTTDAIEGDIAGFADDWICVVPSFASIYRAKGDDKAKKKATTDDEFEEDEG